MERREFKIARMSADIRLGTILLMLLPLGMGVAAISERAVPGLLATGLMLIYAVVWLYWRPSAFLVTGEALEITWPLRKRKIIRKTILATRVVSSRQIKREVGWRVRIGVGGLWGGFGWLWTQKRGLVKMYISSTTEMVWIDCGIDRPWLISPSAPLEFVASLLPESAGPAPASG